MNEIREGALIEKRGCTVSFVRSRKNMFLKFLVASCVERGSRAGKQCSSIQQILNRLHSGSKNGKMLNLSDLLNFTESLYFCTKLSYVIITLISKTLSHEGGSYAQAGKLKAGEDDTHVTFKEALEQVYGLKRFISISKNILFLIQLLFYIMIKK